jgi:putative NIF3 family GTP cyclohydrolase 1 type 2
MTMQERITIEDLNSKFDAYIKSDIEWKAEIEAQLKPLTDNRLDHQIVEKYGIKAFKAAVAILGAAATILIVGKSVSDLFHK